MSHRNGVSSLFVAAALCLLLFCAAGEVRAEDTCTVTIDLQGHGENITIRDVVKGMKPLHQVVEAALLEQGEPEADGFVLRGFAKESSYPDADALSEGFAEYEDAVVDGDVTVYAIWFRQIREVHVSIGAPVCGTETTTSGFEYEDEYGETAFYWETDQQTNPPEVTVSAGQGARLAEEDEEVYHSHEWIERIPEPGDDWPDLFIGTFRGGENYASYSMFFLEPEFGWAFPEADADGADYDVTFFVNGQEKPPADYIYESAYTHAHMVYLFHEVTAVHDPGTVIREKEVAPTCETDGSYDEVVRCKAEIEGAACGAEISRKTVTLAAPGHDWDEGKVTKPATAAAEGERTYTCRRDPSHTKTEVIAKTGGADAETTPGGSSAADDSKSTTESAKTTVKSPKTGEPEGGTEGGAPLMGALLIAFLVIAGRRRSAAPPN